jgi:hypothetical protein
MRRLFILALLAVFLGIPGTSRATTDEWDPGAGKHFNYWFLKIPFGTKPDDAKETTEAGKNDERKDRETTESKVDDALRKASETK